MCVVPTYLSLYDGPQKLQDSVPGLRWLLQRQHVLHSFPYCLHCVLKNTHRFWQTQKKTYSALSEISQQEQHTHLLKLFSFGKITDMVHHANAVAQAAVWVKLLGKKNHRCDVMQSIMGKKLNAWWVWVCMNMQRHSLSSAHLDDVSRNDELRRFGFTLFARWPWGSQPKDPLDLVLQTFFAGLFIHCYLEMW